MAGVVASRSGGPPRCTPTRHRHRGGDARPHRPPAGRLRRRSRSDGCCWLADKPSKRSDADHRTSIRTLLCDGAELAKPPRGATGQDKIGLDLLLEDFKLPGKVPFKPIARDKSTDQSAMQVVLITLCSFSVNESANTAHIIQCFSPMLSTERRNPGALLGSEGTCASSIESQLSPAQRSVSPIRTLRKRGIRGVRPNPRRLRILSRMPPRGSLSLCGTVRCRR